VLNSSEKAYCLALKALKQRKYALARNYFEQAAVYFCDNQEFILLRETTSLLLAVKQELSNADTENDKLMIEEVFSNGKETNFS